MMHMRAWGLSGVGYQLEMVFTLRRDASAGRFSGAQWQSHVLANMPFYSLLLPLFLEFTRSRVSFRCDESLEGLKRVRPSALYILQHAGLCGFAGFWVLGTPDLMRRQ